MAKSACSPGACPSSTRPRVRVVACDHPALTAALWLGFRERLELNVTPASSLQVAAATAIQEQPDVCIIQTAEVSAPTEIAILQGLRTRLRRGMIVKAIRETLLDVKQDLRWIDGLVSVDNPETDLPIVFESFLDESSERARVGVTSVPAVLEMEHGATIETFLPEIRDLAAVFTVPADRLRGTVRAIRVQHPDGATVLVPCATVWQRQVSAEEAAVGVRLLDASLADLRRLRELRFLRLATDGQGDVIVLSGTLDDGFPMPALQRIVTRVGRFDLGEISGATLPGLLRLYDFTRALPQGMTVRLQRVPADVAAWLARILRGEARCVVESTVENTPAGGATRGDSAQVPASGALPKNGRLSSTPTESSSAVRCQPTEGGGLSSYTPAVTLPQKSTSER